jgi:ribosomal protein S18 acetylase RimI-like enzyme
MDREKRETICRFILTPTDDQISQIIGLYRSQGWWQPFDDFRDGLIQQLISGSHSFVVAEQGGLIIGMGRAISDGVSDAYIQDLTVCPSCRKRGIGQRILQALLERLHRDGISWIGLIAERGSCKLYQHAGFREMSGSIPMLMVREQ